MHMSFGLCTQATSFGSSARVRVFYLTPGAYTRLSNSDPCFLLSECSSTWTCHSNFFFISSGMIEEFVAASKLLNEALARYVSACTNIHSSCVRGDWPQINSTLRELSDRIANELVLVATYESRLRTAKTTISRARNYCTAIVPVNALPDEPRIQLMSFQSLPQLPFPAGPDAVHRFFNLCLR